MSDNQPANGGHNLHVVFGSGGTKAVLAGAGAILAFHVAGMKNWQSIGAASGGSIPAGVLAANMSPEELLPRLLDTDIERLLVPNTGLLGRSYALLNKYKLEKLRPRRGAYGTAKLRRFINEMIPEWPERFWTVASCSHGQVLFTSQGVFKYSGDQRIRSLLTQKPPSVGMAVCASCAMPGVIDSVKFAGELLFDGALSGDGEVPVDVIGRHFAGDDSRILAIDIGPDPIKKRRWLRFLWNLFCGGTCETDIDAVHPIAREGLIIVQPQMIEGFHALQFRLSRDQKWHAVVNGFLATTEAICDNNLVDAKAQADLKFLAKRFSELNALRSNKRYQFTRAVEKLLCEQGLFCARESA